MDHSNVGAASMRRRTARRLWFCGLLFVGITLGVILARPAWSRWQHRRTVKQAVMFLQKRDFRSASIAARQALTVRPNDPAVVALCAEIATQTRSPEAILWLMRLVQLRPGDSRPLLALAQTAFNAGETRMAADALGLLSPADRESATAHALAGSIALADKDWARAETHFSAFARLNPDAPEGRLNLAALKLRDPKGPQAELARAELNQIRLDPSMTIAALRILLADARALSNSAAARQIAVLLHDAPAASPEDRLRLLDELALAGDPQLAETLGKDQVAAATNPNAVAVLLRWMNAHHLSAQSCQWLDSLPQEIRAEPLLLLVRVESAAAAGLWAEVRARTTDDNPDWRSFQFLRFAFAARASVEIAKGHRRPDFRTRWERALNSTAGNPIAVSMLAGLAHSWGWNIEAAELWWLLARQPIGAQSPLRALWRLAAVERDASALLRVARRVAELEPANSAATNNLAWLLLLKGESLPEAHRLAARNLANHPEDPRFCSTAALSLLKQNREAEGAALFSKLDAAALRPASMRACAGVVFAAAGKPQEARPLLESARAAASDLLPEELKLVEEALKP